MVLLERNDDETGDRREAVAAYIVQVNTTQQALIVELDGVSRAYRELQLKETADAKQLARLEAAEQTLRGLRSRFAAIPAPAEARQLRRRLLTLVDLQVGLAEEVSGMARYIPLQAAENRKLADATAALRERLGEAGTGSEQQAAFDDYRTTVSRSADRLEGASAPAVLAPTRSGEIERRRRLARLARQLGEALQEQSAADVDELFPRFVQTSAANGTTRAERAAVVAFNSRLKRIGEQRNAVVEERARLDLSLS